MDDIDDPNMLRAEAVIEYTKEDTEKFIQRPISIFPRIWHKWGRTGITKTPDILFTLIRENGQRLPPVAERFKVKRAELVRDAGRDEKAEKLLDLARWCWRMASLTNRPPRPALWT